jgi:hypothetical protein
LWAIRLHSMSTPFHSQEGNTVVFFDRAGHLQTIPFFQRFEFLITTRRKRVGIKKKARERESLKRNKYMNKLEHCSAVNVKKG